MSSYRRSDQHRIQFDRADFSDRDRERWTCPRLLLSVAALASRKLARKFTMASVYYWKKLVIGLVVVNLLIYLFTHPWPFKSSQDDDSFDPDYSEIFSRRKLSGPYEGYRDCNPAKGKLAFLKTHKCASSTVQNMLLRYALKNRMNVVMPLTGNYVGRYRPFHRSVLWGTPWDAASMEYDLFCLHTIWNYPEVEAVMGGGNQTIYFTILRDPVELFISLWDYAALGTYFGTTLEGYALLGPNKTGRFRDRSQITNLGRNQMLWDMGLSLEDMEDPEAVEAKIREAEDTFDLVMIAERFDESVVLLRELLCWEYKDVAYFKLNSRKEGSKSKISDEARKELEKWLWADYQLYNHFLEKFDQSVHRFGPSRMSQQVRILSKANSNVASKCVEGTADNSELASAYRTWGKDMIGYRVKKENEEFCRHYIMGEVPFIDLHRERQAERAKVKMERENRTMPSILVDPQKFRLMVDKDGKPDIEMMKKVFVYRRMKEENKASTSNDKANKVDFDNGNDKDDLSA